MKLDFVETISENSSGWQPFDLAVLAAGYESRCCDLGVDLHKRGLLMRGKVLVMAFAEHQEASQRLINDSILRGIATTWEIVSEKDGESVERLFIDAVMALTNEAPKFRVFVDISSMSRPWYAGVVLALRRISTTKPLEVVFGYTVGKFDGIPDGYPPSEIVCPVQGFSATESPDRPSALVLSLGYDPGRGLGLREYLDPELTLVVASGNPNYPNYLEAVEDANRDLFELVAPEERFEYDIADPAAAFYTLRSLCSGLAEDWRVVLASVGPKLVGLIFFLLGVTDERLSVWRVSGGSKIAPRNVFGAGPILMGTAWVDE